jgi:hypothetical protein
VRQEQTVESGFVVRPAGQAAPSAGRKSAIRDAVPASLSAPQTVTAIAKSTEARAEDNSNVRKIVVDAQSREAINQALDAARQLVRQPPEDAKQRLRAYTRRSAASQAKPRDGLDLEV